MAKKMTPEELGKAWGEWFNDWDIVCSTYHEAYRSGASDVVLGSIIRAQQALMKVIPKNMVDLCDY